MTDREAYQQAYSDYNRTLRAWFVAFGVGGPVLFVTQESFRRLISDSPHSRLIISCFALAVVLQTVGAFINKWMNYYQLLGEEDSNFRKKRRWKVAHAIFRHEGVDIGIDLGSIILFAIAVVVVLVNIDG